MPVVKTFFSSISCFSLSTVCSTKLSVQQCSFYDYSLRATRYASNLRWHAKETVCFIFVSRTSTFFCGYPLLSYELSNARIFKRRPHIVVKWLVPHSFKVYNVMEVNAVPLQKLLAPSPSAHFFFYCKYLLPSQAQLHSNLIPDAANLAEFFSLANVAAALANNVFWTKFN